MKRQDVLEPPHPPREPAEAVRLVLAWREAMTAGRDCEAAFALESLSKLVTRPATAAWEWSESKGR